MLSQSKINSIAGIIKNIPHIACAYIHGSALKKSFTKESDIDIALLLLPGVKPDLTAIIQNYTAAIVLMTNHIPHFSILSSKNVVFAKEVLAAA